MSRMIEFKYPCPACKFVSGQAGRKPTLITPTTGWITCPECECKLQISLTFSTRHKRPDGVPGPSLQIFTLQWKQSKKHLDKIMAQRERDKKRADELKNRVDAEGVVVLPPEQPTT